MTPTEPQYIVYFDHPEARGLHSLRYFDGSKVGGVQVAAHERLQSVRHAIPMTHERAPFEQEAPMVEVWVLTKFVDRPEADDLCRFCERKMYRDHERYRGWHDGCSPTLNPRSEERTDG